MLRQQKVFNLLCAAFLKHTVLSNAIVFFILPLFTVSSLSFQLSIVAKLLEENKIKQSLERKKAWANLISSIPAVSTVRTRTHAHTHVSLTTTS